MSPTVRSRLLASGTAFLFGFILANVGIWRVLGPDRTLWLGIAAIFMLTGAVGVILSDSPRRISIWAVVGFELMVAFTVVPLVWTFTIAAASDLGTPTAILPQEVHWSNFGDALTDASIKPALTNSILVAVISTVVSLAVAVPAAHALVHRNLRRGSLFYLAVVTLLLSPLMVFQGALAAQLRSTGLIGFRLAAVPAMLLVTIPLAIWLCVSALRDVPWTLRDAIRVEGGSRREEIRSFALPIVGPSLLIVAALVFVAAMNDVAVGAVMMSSGSSRLLPATLLLSTGEMAYPSARVAATALLLLLPTLVLLMAAPRRILSLIGGTHR